MALTGPAYSDRRVPTGLAHPAKSATYLFTTSASMLLTAKIVNTKDQVRTLLPPPGNEESVEKP
jgi:hypothetical protein